MNQNSMFVQRCFDLARLGAGAVSPNPMVGAVLVHEGKIIGEGWHKKYGEAHAEVNCLRSVAPENEALIPYSTLFCNLEPCAHFGKTPPCADLILAKKIPHVVVSNVDPNPLVGGKGLEKLRAGGVQVETGILEEAGHWLNRAFFTSIEKQRPYIVLKWAQSADGLLGWIGERTAISGVAASRLVHRWRSECDAVLVGATTALVDNPRLDTRFFEGKNPLRLVLGNVSDMPADHHLLDDSAETWFLGSQDIADFGQTRFIPLPIGLQKDQTLPYLLNALKKERRTLLLVEGGANVLNQFLSQQLWDEIRVIENTKFLRKGLAAPALPATAVLREQFEIDGDSVHIFTR